DGIDDERLAPVELGHLEAHARRALADAAAAQHSAAPGVFLVDDGLLLTDETEPGPEQQLSARAGHHLVHAPELDLDGTWLRARSDHEVVFETIPLAVEDQVDAGTDRRDLQPRVVADVGVPARGIGSSKVIAPAGQLVESDRVSKASALDPEMHARR